ncbi:hypothetical protein LSAT2_007357 [Lamellibrachia satsuma]|nr:hypothetical protein LSAT2_007357 [Lamellibrachia satsuma]
MACMGNFHAFGWKSDSDKWMPETNDTDTMDQQNNTAEQSYPGDFLNFPGDESPSSRKTWSESMQVKPINYQDMLCCESQSYSNRIDNVQSLLQYDEDAARNWPDASYNSLPKIGSPFRQSDVAPGFPLQPTGNCIYRRPRPTCDITKFVNDMNKTYKTFKMYGQSGLALPQ